MLLLRKSLNSFRDEMFALVYMVYMSSIGTHHSWLAGHGSIVVQYWALQGVFF